MARFALVPTQSFVETYHNGQKYLKTTIFHKHLFLANLDHKEKKQLGKQLLIAERHQMSQRYLKTTDLTKFKNSCLLS